MLDTWVFFAHFALASLLTTWSEIVTGFSNSVSSSFLFCLCSSVTSSVYPVILPNLTLLGKGRF